MTIHDRPIQGPQGPSGPSPTGSTNKSSSTTPPGKTDASHQTGKSAPGQKPPGPELSPAGKGPVLGRLTSLFKKTTGPGATGATPITKQTSADVNEAIAGAKELIKAGGGAVLTLQQQQDAENELHIHIEQTIYGSEYQQENPEKHALPHFQHYAGTFKIFSVEMKIKENRDGFMKDCNRMEEQLNSLKDKSTGPQNTEIDNCLKWLGNVKEAFENFKW